MLNLEVTMSFERRSLVPMFSLLTNQYKCLWLRIQMNSNGEYAVDIAVYDAGKPSGKESTRLLSRQRAGTDEK